METIKAIYTRHSVRAFKDDPIEPQLLTTIVTDAQQTPSWGNSQPWQVYIATGHALTNIKQHYATAADQGIAEDADFSKAHRGDFSAVASQNMGHWVGTFRPVIDSDPTTYWGIVVLIFIAHRRLPILCSMLTLIVGQSMI